MNTEKYTKLEIFAKALRAGGSVQVISDHGECQEIPAGQASYKWIQIPVEKNTEYEIFCRECQVSICYLSGCENILDEGVCYLEQDEKGRFIRMPEPSWYDSPIRETYHFTPWKNWINDPNGLCWFQGYYHMFYQFNPHSQRWSHMYWGHAASRDLIHWTHLPVVLEPQEEILKYPEELEGGAFSGSAVVDGDEVVFYLTRSMESRIDGGEFLQQQWRMKSSDMLNFSKEELVIGEKPAGASPDFRDPKVTRADGRWVMALGSALEGKAAILKYESEDMENWEYTGPLLIEEEEGIRCMECPDFMELDGKYLVIGALMCHQDPFGRYQMSRYYVGDFKDGIFTEENRGWFDFGSNCYAMQSFEHGGRRISIGWISDFYGEHQEAENGAYGSMTIPREMHIRDHRLYLTPVKEIEALKMGALYQGQGEEISLKDIAPNTYKAELEFDKDCSFSICLSENAGGRMLLIHDEKGLRLKTCGVKSEHITFPADVGRVEKLEIFVDRRTAEIYVNDGEAAGTKLFYDTSDAGCFILHTDTPECIKRAEVFCMRSIWGTWQTPADQ